MALPAKRTLQEMRTELLARLGFASQGASAGAIITTANSHLQRAQEVLYWQYDFKELWIKPSWTTGVGQTLYDWPDDVDPRRITKFRVLYSGVWHPMEEGVEFYHDTSVDTRFFPRRFDRGAQLEIWPEPDAAYTIRADAYARLGRFSQDGDRCTIDDTLVFLMALANGKAHYRQPDAASYQQQLNGLLSKLKAAVHGDKRYIVGRQEEAPMVKPQTVDYSA